MTHGSDETTPAAAAEAPASNTTSMPVASPAPPDASATGPDCPVVYPTTPVAEAVDVTEYGAPWTARLNRRALKTGIKPKIFTATENSGRLPARPPGKLSSELANIQLGVLRTPLFRHLPCKSHTA
ncbi:hypothetical protein PHYPSEUDO_011183 [Phytophthora pseudosyringae]|uniref:Uncharacterized protein n=1 Tax=Phytophthora pseudosyringae TaxID=221518 RepID=A0A8T1V8M3_9STRA|nr:hypothetical protein PHYPSEUDO_011183 [Phytophthora pseudosyringae]